MHSAGLKRALALAATAGVLAFAGGIPASAEPSAPSPAPGPPAPNGGAEPPLLDPADVAPSTPVPQPGSFTQKQGCLQPNAGNANIPQKPWSQQALGFERAHAEGFTGSGVKIAVIDSGVNPHPRLHNLESGPSVVPDHRDSLYDCDGHGTTVAGIIGTAPDPSSGFVGIAPDATILSIRQNSSVWQNEQTGQTVGDTKTMAESINYAVTHGGQVVNISQASCQPFSSAFNTPGNAELQNAVKAAHDAGVVIVVAAANVGGQCQKNAPGNPTTAVLPAWFASYTLTVGSIGPQGGPSAFTVPGPWVGVSAPGEQLISVDPAAGASGLANQLAGDGNGQPQPIQGTSFAAPYVSGLAALIKQKYGNQMSADQIIERIKATAMHPGGNGGHNDIVGYGMINPMAALDNVIPSEFGKPNSPVMQSRLPGSVIPRTDWPPVLVAVFGALGGVGAVVFVAFSVNAVKRVRARRAALPQERWEP